MKIKIFLKQVHKKSILLIIFLYTCSGTFNSNSKTVDVKLFDINIEIKPNQYSDFLHTFYTRDYNKTIELYTKGRNEVYAPIIAGRAYYGLKKYNEAVNEYLKAIDKNPLLKDLVFYRLGEAFDKMNNYEKANYYYLMIPPDSVYYHSGRDKTYSNLIKVKKYSDLLNISDNINLSETYFYKAKASLLINNKAKFNDYFSALTKSTPNRLNRKVLRLWIEAGKPFISNAVSSSLALSAYNVRQYREALNILLGIKNVTLKDKNLVARVYLKLNQPAKALEIFDNLRKINNEQKEFAEYMFYRCNSFMGKENIYLEGMKIISEQKNHSQRFEAVKMLLVQNAKNNHIDNKLIKLISDNNKVNPSFIFHLIEQMKVNNSTNLLKWLNAFLIHSTKPLIKAFLHNIIGEIYESNGKINNAASHYLISAKLTSTLYSNLSYLALVRLNKHLEQVLKEIYRTLLEQKENMKKIIQSMKQAEPFSSDKADAFLQIGDTRRAWEISYDYLQKKGFHNLLSVIRYFINKNFISIASEYTIMLREYLFNRGFNNTFYYDIGEIAFPKTHKHLFQNLKNPKLTKAVVFGESFFYNYAYSRAGAIGLTQQMPETARWVGKNRNLSISEIYDPKKNIEYGDKFISWLLSRNNDYIDALGSYNAGPGRFNRYIKQYKDKSISQAHFISKVPLDETRDYIDKILTAYTFLLITGI